VRIWTQQHAKATIWAVLVALVLTWRFHQQAAQRRAVHVGTCSSCLAGLEGDSPVSFAGLQCYYYGLWSDWQWQDSHPAGQCDRPARAGSGAAGCCGVGKRHCCLPRAVQVQGWQGRFNSLESF
jgi:hypothetical protein